MSDDRSEEERLADAERKAHQELDRANRARQIMEDPLFRDAVEAVKDQLYKDFAASPLEDDKQRLSARIGIDMLDRVLTSLRKHVETGKMAALSLADIDRKKTMMQRLRRVS